MKDRFLFLMGHAFLQFAVGDRGGDMTKLIVQKVFAGMRRMEVLLSGRLLEGG